MSQPLLELSHISRYYQSGETVVKALDDVSLTVWPGEFLAIMGQSGSGKSTLMNLIGCLDKATNGTYRIFGKEASSLDSDALAALRRETFGFVFQRYNLLATATAEENVEIPAIYSGMAKGHRLQRARELLTQLGLGERADHRPNQLSGGQQQRVAIARSLMNNPPVILADEPTGALDSRSGQEVMELLKKLHGEGRTIILITHDEQVASHAERIVRMQDGRIIEDSASKPVASHLSMRQDNKALTHHAGLAGETQEAVKTALRSLRVNLFRTALTLLGIIIGVAAVITMLAIGNGSKAKVLEQISAMGTNIINIRPGAPGVRSSGDNATLTPQDAKALEDLPNIAVVVPNRSGSKTLRVGNVDYNASVEGVSGGFPAARDWKIASGTFFTDRDMESYAPVAVLGKTVQETLFPGSENPIGQYVLVGTVPFLIIGTMEAKGAAPWGADQDNVIFIPLTTGLIRVFGSTYINSVIVKITSTDKVDETQEAIRSLLMQRHGKEDFQVRNTSSFLEMATETQNTLTVLLGAVAAISLLVGGIGVMNIMLVSVTERTREIGIRMATGARMRDIMVQFNTEAAVVCTIGGVIGIALGLLAGWVISLFDVNVLFTPAPAFLAFGCAVATGLLFGYLPAKKAAQLDPVVALSSE